MTDSKMFAANSRHIIFAGLLLAGLLLRLISARGSLWYDESFSAWLVTLPTGRLLAATLGDVHPPAFYLLLRAAVMALGASELVLRLPSLISGLALIWATYRLSSSLKMSNPARLGAAALVALLPFQIYYSTEARSYALQMLLIVLAALGLVERRGWLFVAGCVIALYLQHTAALAVVALFVAGWWMLPRRRWLAYGLIVAAGYLPGLAILAIQARAVAADFWILPLNHPGRVADVLDNLLWWMPHNPLPVTGLVTGLAVVLILADTGRLWHEQRLALIMWSIPLLLAVGASLLWQPVLIARILAPSAPFFYMLIADVTTRSRPRALWWAVAGLAIVAISGAMIAGRAGRPPAAQLYTIPDYRPGDGVFHFNVGTYLPYHYYWPEADQYLFEQDNTLGTSISTATKTAMGVRQARFADVKCNHNRWWIITLDNPTSTPQELAATAAIATYGDEISTLRSDDLVHSRLYLVSSNCGYSGL